MSRTEWQTPAFSDCVLDSTSKQHLKSVFFWIHRTMPLVKWILESMTSFYHLSSQDLSFSWVTQAVCTIDVSSRASWYFSSNTLWALTRFVCIPVGKHTASCRAGNEFIVIVYRKFYLSFCISVPSVPSDTSVSLDPSMDILMQQYFVRGVKACLLLSLFLSISLIQNHLIPSRKPKPLKC